MQTEYSHIIQKRFSQVNEDVATDALTYILNSSESAHRGMMKFINSIESNIPDLRFQSQQTEENMRPDILDIHKRGEQYGRFLKNIFNEWGNKDIGRVFVQIFDDVLGAWIGYPPNLCIFIPTCGNALVIEHNGSLYSCEPLC